METYCNGIRIVSRVVDAPFSLDAFTVRKPYFYERWLFGTTWASRAVVLFEQTVADIEAALAHKDAFLSEAEVAVKKASWALNGR